MKKNYVNIALKKTIGVMFHGTYFRPFWVICNPQHQYVDVISAFETVCSVKQYALIYTLEGGGVVNYNSFVGNARDEIIIFVSTKSEFYVDKMPQEEDDMSDEEYWYDFNAKTQSLP